MGAATAPPCSPGQICSEQFGTKVDGTNLYFSTATTINSDNKGTTTLNYWNGSEWKASATSENGKPFTPTTDSPLSDTAKLSLKSGDLGKNASAVTSQSLDKAGVPKTTKDNVVPGSKNQASTNSQNGDPQSTPEQEESAGKENESFKEGTRRKYSDVYYPADLSLQDQDCIKFSILEYQPSLQSATGEQTDLGRPEIDVKNILGSIILPIPAGINDNNTVGWQSDTLNLLEEAGANVATALMQKGMKGAEESVKSTTERLSAATKAGELQKGLSGLFGGLAVGKNTIQQRAYGSTFNNNLELLFNGPSLRSFSFNFKLSPRNAPEAKTIMTIIRYFKQAMSVKRSQTTLLLKTPRTFAISYLTSNKEHPYLNKFKECALTGFNVNYTPEGQYMTYMSSNIDERSMISYEISLSFEELEPIFDDEYGNETTITSIGY